MPKPIATFRKNEYSKLYTSGICEHLQTFMWKFKENKGTVKKCCYFPAFVWKNVKDIPFLH